MQGTAVEGGFTGLSLKGPVGWAYYHRRHAKSLSGLPEQSLAPRDAA